MEAAEEIRKGAGSGRTGGRSTGGTTMKTGILRGRVVGRQLTESECLAGWDDTEPPDPH
jgi:hypothetical protein